MRTSFLPLLLILLSWIPDACSSKSLSGFRTIYNEDNRISLDEDNSKLSVYSHQIAMLSHRHFVQSTGVSDVSFKPRTLGNVLQLCSSERFGGQWMLGDCTGFSFDGKTLITARHCIPDATSCEGRVFVFGRTHPSDISFSSSQVRSCRKIISAFEKEKGDLVVVALDRPLENFSGVLRAGRNVSGIESSHSRRQLFAIGHPFGIAQIASPIEGFFHHQFNPIFMTALADVAQGMSGAPLIDLDQKEVLGVLIGGDRDLEWSEAESCNRSRNCSGDKCSGEKFANPLTLNRLLKAASQDELY